MLLCPFNTDCLDRKDQFNLLSSARSYMHHINRWHDKSLHFIPVNILLADIADRSKAVLLLWILFVVCICLCHTSMSVSCRLEVTCWERVDLLTLLNVMFSCVLVTFPYDVLGQVWYLIVSIPVLCILSYLH